MFNPQRPPFEVIWWTDENPGIEGNDGWYHDTDTIRFIFFSGTWFEENSASKFGGFGDVFADLDFLPTRETYTGGLVHRGFYRYANDAYKTLRKIGLLDTPKKICLVGHSLGASVAALLSLILANSVYKVKLVSPVLFASPACASRRTRKKFRKLFPETRNYFCGNDGIRLLKYILPYGSIAPEVVLKQKHGSFINWVKGFVLDHLPSVAQTYPDPTLIRR